MQRLDEVKQILCLTCGQRESPENPALDISFLVYFLFGI